MTDSGEQWRQIHRSWRSLDVARYKAQRYCPVPCVKHELKVQIFEHFSIRIPKLQQESLHDVFFFVEGIQWPFGVDGDVLGMGRRPLNIGSG